MLRKLLGMAIAMALPSLLAAQAPRVVAAAAAPKLAPPQVLATQVQGDVVVDHLDDINNQEGTDEVDGNNNDGELENGEFEQEGMDEPDGPNNDVDAGDQVDQVGENEEGDTPPAPPAAIGQLSRIGRHKP